MLRRIVLIGATGFFGRRLAEHLAAIDGIELVLTSRDDVRARSVAQAIGDTHPNAKIDAMAFDRDDPHGFERLVELSPWLVIDASGPFQSVSYDLARAALERRRALDRPRRCARLPVGLRSGARSYRTP